MPSFIMHKCPTLSFMPSFMIHQFQTFNKFKDLGTGMCTFHFQLLPWEDLGKKWRTDELKFGEEIKIWCCRVEEQVRCGRKWVFQVRDYRLGEGLHIRFRKLEIWVEIWVDFWGITDELRFKKQNWFGNCGTGGCFLCVL